ncbi:MAG: GxxExxY protein [Bacteroidota bacterium]
MKQFVKLPLETEIIARQIVDAAYIVHKTLGPGLLESTYDRSLAHELRIRGINVNTQIHIPVRYKDLYIPYGYRLDLMVQDQIIVEIKSVEQELPVHRAQLLTYLRLTEKRLGFLINFNVPIIKNGIKRVIL